MAPDVGQAEAWADKAEVDSAGSDEEAEEEPEEVKRIAAGRAPTQQQRQRHEEENHSCYREWCEVCVAARGIGTQHRKKKKDQLAEEEGEGPRIFSDYYFMSQAPDAATMLAL